VFPRHVRGGMGASHLSRRSLSKIPMPLPAQTTQNDLHATDAGASDSGPLDATVDLAAHGVAAPSEIVQVELNFNAFADHCPPTQHARRVARPSDPSIQDFADQALEIAALRAEVKRLNRDCEALQRTVRTRDQRVQTLQDQLVELRNSTRSSTVTPAGAPLVVDVAREDDRSVGQRAIQHDRDVPALTPALSETVMLPIPALDQSDTVSGTTPLPALESHSSPPAPRHRLISLDQDGGEVPLSRDIMTIGRTRENDICIASNAVSRDHARLLLSSRSVTIVDMDSANGCFVNDERVRKHKLRDGDVVRIGDRSYRFANDTTPR
jgi:FHA domain